MRKIELFQIKKIYAIGDALEIVDRKNRDDDLHALIQGMTGKESVKALTYKEAGVVIAWLEKLQGSAPAASPKRLKKEKEHPERPGGVTSGQQKKIWALMYELKKYDQSPESAPLGDRLCAIIKKELGVDAIAQKPFAWVTFSQGNTLIEMLKRYVESQKRKEAGQ